MPDPIRGFHDVRAHIGKTVGKLTAAKRKKIPRSQFGLPGSRKYPMPDRSHAANAKARATQQVKKGNLSPAAKEKIDAKVNRILGKKERSMNGRLKSY